MTAAPTPLEPQPALTPESFWAIVLRRTKYLAAILLSGLLFYYLGWLVAAPPANVAGVSLVIWPPTSAIFASIILALILVLATAICTVIVHPDSPHMGLFCALLGMTALSIRGGDVYMLFNLAAAGGNYSKICRYLAIECTHWSVIFLIGEAVARILHDKFFANTRWLTRSGVDLSNSLKRIPGKSGVDGISASVGGSIGTLRLPRPIAVPLALIVNIALAMLFLYIFLHSASKGQVIFACFISFLLAAHLVYYAFPNVPSLVLFLAVPATGAIGYLLTANYLPKYPGHPGLFFARALPIDYIAAGIPGAILGFYMAYHWDLHSRSEQPTT
jgi:hypothetical protein